MDMDKILDRPEVTEEIKEVAKAFCEKVDPQCGVSASIVAALLADINSEHNKDADIHGGGKYLRMHVVLQVIPGKTLPREFELIEQMVDSVVLREEVAKDGVEDDAKTDPE
ncbi:MAG: hypothetical protein DRH06_00310 [Deltaproteobacteria bacterium]|nr:MAG: hypothetical protein DRH06_00310 [Deltaproteobacteria bacterium]